MQLQCVNCSGKGCEECGTTGWLVIDRCPHSMVDARVAEIVRYADLYEKGLPPVAGGALDQCQGFVDACVFLMREKELVKCSESRSMQRR